MSLPLTIQFLLCPIVLLALLRVTAPYGRHHRGGWGPTLPNRLAWALMEAPALVVIAWLVLASAVSDQAVVWIPLVFWLVHYTYRTFLFPALMRPSDRTFPALLVLFAIAFNILNGYNNAHALIENGQQGVPTWTWNFLAGTGLFWAGFVIHVHSDHVIRSLRRPGETGYAIPDRGLHRLVSSPAYFGEMLQWAGWAVMTWSLAGVAFALFTVCNLLPRAIANRRWYRETFPGYPARRRILVPGLF